MKKLTKGLLAVAMSLTIAGCSSNSSSESYETVTSAGSTSMETLCTAMNESYLNDTGNEVTTEYTGSGAGIESLLAGTVDIGNSSRNLTDEEKSEGAVENIVAIDGIAVIVNNSNTVSNLTTEQLTAIYKGEITNWSEVGGEDLAIVVIGRESGSGTRSAFEELLDVEDVCAYAQEIDSTGAVVAKVEQIEGAIGYVSLDVVDDSVTALSLNGYEATEENIVAGDYALQRPFVMATLGEISEQSEAVQAYFEYIYSDAGTEVVEAAGLIAVDAE